jgi:hypothetical protein
MKFEQKMKKEDIITLKSFLPHLDTNRGIAFIIGLGMQDIRLSYTPSGTLGLWRIDLQQTYSECKTKTPNQIKGYFNKKLKKNDKKRS